MNRISYQLLSRFSEFVANEMGLHFPEHRWGDLEKSIATVMAEFGHTDAESCLHWLLSARLAIKQIQILASALTVGETYFFRDLRSFDALSQRIFPELIRTGNGDKRMLRIWSAGCSTGEEAYSIAIAFDRFLPAAQQQQISILATDINPRALNKAAEGIFGDWSFRDAPAWLKEDYFTPKGPHRFEIVPRIKKRVTFSYLNLAEDVYPSLSNNTNAMDLIFCRNVIMYFTPERAKKVVGNFQKTLVESGWLMVSVVETSSEIFSQFVCERLEGAFLYRKIAPHLRTPDARREAESPWKQPLQNTRTFPLSPFTLPDEPQSKNVQDLMLDREQLPSPPNSWEEGVMLFDRGRYEDAVRKLKEDPARLKTAAMTADMSNLLARACANSGHLAEARDWAEKAIAQDKLNPALHYLRATIVQEQGILEEAITSFKHAIYLDPNFVLGHFGLGNQMLRQGKLKQADKHFRNALALLADSQPNEIIPHSDGLAAGRLRELIESTRFAEQTE